MHDSAGRPETRVTANGKVIVLLLPEALGAFSDAKLLARTLKSRPAVRVLLCLPDTSGHHFIGMLKEIGVETEILVGDGVAKPAVERVFVLCALPSTERKQLIEFALTLSDFVLVESKTTSVAVVSTAKELGKERIVPGEPLPQPATSIAGSIVERLDPEIPRPLRARGLAGRLEQLLLEFFAFNWLKSKEGRAESRKRLRRCFARRWPLDPYFAPGAWRDLAPDAEAKSDTCEMVARFNALDRSALYGSYVHRDLAWVAYFGAALAVLAAVAGHLTHRVEWGIVELLTLIVVGFSVIGSRHMGLQDRWTACRFAAEQLRIARMSVPLLVLPEPLTTTDRAPANPDHGSKEVKLDFLALTEVKRIVRDHGLPRLDPDLKPAKAAEWLLLIVNDQIVYHNRNHRKLDHAEHNLRQWTRAIFVVALIAVLAHFFVKGAEWLLYFTAAAPAFAAALHGTGTRLGIVHRAALSLEADTELTRIKTLLTDRKWDSANATEDWRELRRIAYMATTAMGRENTSWHGLVRRYQDDVP